MSPAVDVPLFAAAAVAAAAVTLTAFALGRRRHAGLWWWVAAVWLTALGSLAAALLPALPARVVGAPLLMQWPLVALIGLRRFFVRQPWPGSERSDALLLGVTAAFVGLAGWALPPQHQWLVSLAAITSHLYAAAVLFMRPDDPDDIPLHGLGAAMALAAFAPGMAVLPGAELMHPLAARAAAETVGALVLTLVALTLVCDRTEVQLRDAQRRLRTLGNLDALTQVPNRRHFSELAEQALRHDPPGSAALLLFGVDHFKQLNHHLGHAAGDRALCLVSASVLEHLRAADVAGRHGGDEFVLLLRRATTHDAMGVAARIVDEVQARALSSQLPTLSLSFGLAQVGEGEEIIVALRRADQALYEAKRQGRSRAVAALGDESRPVFSESQRLGLSAA